ncbi:MAG TPA: hypothetical protein QF804_05860 [Rhodospirillales bacterium]|jgi:hypothetical protein|nr:hypothetical protein [Rhodospirillales bacterium]
MSRAFVSRALAVAAAALVLLSFRGGGATEIACISCGLQADPARSQPTTIGVIPAAAQCVRVQRRQYGENLVNACDLCATVKIEHRRPGAQFPTFRDYTLPTGSTLPLPFRGGGKTRILTERACGGDTLQNPASDRCVQFRPVNATVSVLLNPCAKCRAVVVARGNGAGGRSIETMAIAPKSYVQIAANITNRPQIISEKSCR